MFVALGIIGVVIAMGYSRGDAMRLGPGSFPLIVSLTLAVLGSVVTVKGVIFGGQRPARLPWRPLIVIPASMVLFGVLLSHMGLVLSCVALICCSALAGRGPRPLEIVFLALGLAAFSVGVFAYGLNIPLRIWPL